MQYGRGRASTPERFAIMLAQALEDHSPGRCIHPHGKGLGGEQHLDEPTAEQHLHNLLHDRQQPYVRQYIIAVCIWLIPVCIWWAPAWQAPLFSPT